MDMNGAGSEDRVFSDIRRIWGTMLRHDATTCWEGWSFIPGHYTRSHCHAWSASPAFLIGACLLGVRPLEPGFTKVLIQPYFESLTWFDGAVPTPHGLVELQARFTENEWDLSTEAPLQIEILFRCPRGFKSVGHVDGAALKPDGQGSLVRHYALRLSRA